MYHSVKSTFNLEDRSTGDDVINLLFAQQLLAPLQQQLNMQDESSSQVGRRLKALTHQLQIFKGQHFSDRGEVEADKCSRLNWMQFLATVRELVVKVYLSWDMRRFTALKQSSRQTVASSILLSPGNDNFK